MQNRLMSISSFLLSSAILNLAVLITICLFLTPSAFADNAAWNVNADGNWITDANWAPPAAPGAPAPSTDTWNAAFFTKTLTADRVVTVDAGRNIKNIRFENTSDFKYTLQTGFIALSNSGEISTEATNGSHGDTISSAIQIQGDGGAASFLGDSTLSTSFLNITGGLTGVSTAGNTTTLYLIGNGSHTSNNTISGVIGDGAAGGKLAVYKSEGNKWILSGLNTYTGGTTINQGTLGLATNDLTSNINFSGDDTVIGPAYLTVGNGVDITGDITNTTTNNGIITFEGASKVTGKIGSTGVGVKLITVGNGAVEFAGAGNILATTINFAGNDELKVAANKNITANIMNSNSNEGTLVLQGTTIVNGDIGSTGAGLKSVELGVAGSVVTADVRVNGNILATKIDSLGNTDNILTIGDGSTITTSKEANMGILNDSANFNLNIIGSATINSNIGGDNTGNALTIVTIDGAGSTVTLNGNFLARDINIDNATVTTVMDISTNNACLNFNLTQGTLDLGANTMTFFGVAADNSNAYTQAAGTTLKTTIQSTTTAGNINTSASTGANAGKCTISAASTLNINLATTSYIPNGTSWMIIDGRAGTGGVNVPTITSNSTRYTFTGTVANNGDDLVVTANVTSGGGFAGDAKSGDSNAQAVGSVLDNIPNPQGDMLNVLNTMTALSPSQVSTSLDTMVPEVDSGVMNNSSASLNNFVNVTMERVENVLKLAQAQGAKTGFSAGDSSKLNGIWAKGYGSYLTQSNRQGIPGYNAWNAGTALGIDRLFQDVATIGVSGGYAYGDVDGNVNNANTYINSAQATLYAGYQPKDIPAFVDMAGCFAYNWYNGRRDINVGNVLLRRANAAYGGQQFGAYLGTGYTFLIAKNVELTPLLSLQWTHLRLNSYTETEAGALSLSVGEQNYDQLLSGVGAKLETPMKQKWGILTPEVHGKWFYDFMGGQNMVVTSTFTGGGAAFNGNGFRAPMNSFNAGGKLTFDFKNDISVTGDCDTQMMEDFFGIYGSVTVRYSF